MAIDSRQQPWADPDWDDLHENTSHAEWQALWHTLGVTPPADQHFAELQQRYAEPARAYHTLRHIDECLAHLRAVEQLVEHLPSVAAALWFHDLIYDPKRSDNEAASAAWAGALLQEAGVMATTRERIQTLILYTQHNQLPPAGDAALLVDIDLAILGAERARFDEYEAQIRHEYAWVPWPTFCHRRAALLQQFLEHPTIYRTPYFHARFTDAARHNLARSIKRLTTAAP